MEFKDDARTANSSANTKNLNQILISLLSNVMYLWYSQLKLDICEVLSGHLSTRLGCLNQPLILACLALGFFTENFRWY